MDRCDHLRAVATGVLIALMAVPALSGVAVANDVPPPAVLRPPSHRRHRRHWPFASAAEYGTARGTALEIFNAVIQTALTTTRGDEIATRIFLGLADLANALDRARDNLHQLRRQRSRRWDLAAALAAKPRHQWRWGRRRQPRRLRQHLRQGHQEGDARRGPRLPQEASMRRHRTQPQRRSTPPCAADNGWPAASWQRALLT